MAGKYVVADSEEDLRKLSLYTEKFVKKIDLPKLAAIQELWGGKFLTTSFGGSQETDTHGEAEYCLYDADFKKFGDCIKVEKVEKKNLALQCAETKILYFCVLTTTFNDDQENKSRAIKFSKTPETRPSILRIPMSGKCLSATSSDDYASEVLL